MVAYFGSHLIGLRVLPSPFFLGLMNPKGATDANESSSSYLSLTDDDERMKDYLHRLTRRAPTRASSPESSCLSPDHRSVSASTSGVGEVLDALPITWALHRLEDGRVYDEPVCSLTLEEIDQFQKEWDIPPEIPLRGLCPGELACAPQDNFIAVHDNMF